MDQVPLLDVVADALRPDPATAALLAAAIGDRACAHDAWARFQACQTSLAHYLRQDDHGVKRVLPLLEHNTRQHGLRLDRESITILRSAAIREEVRFRSFETHGRSGLTALVRAGLCPLVLKGLATAALYYPRPGLRHSHDIDLLVDPGAEPRLTAALSAADFRRVPVPGPHAGLEYQHGSGLPIACHHTAVCLANAEPEPLDLLARSRPAQVLGVPCRVPDPADLLAHLCGHALGNSRRRSFAWLVDAALLIQHEPGFWSDVPAAAARLRVELPVLAVLTDLHERFGVAVPEAVLGALRSGASRIEPLQRRALVQRILRSGHPTLGHLLWRSGWRSRWAILGELNLRERLRRGLGRLPTRPPGTPAHGAPGLPTDRSTDAPQAAAPGQL